MTLSKMTELLARLKEYLEKPRVPESIAVCLFGCAIFEGEEQIPFGEGVVCRDCALDAAPLIPLRVRRRSSNSN